MKAATGEATLTVITIAAIALIVAVFAFWWNANQDKIKNWDPEDATQGN